MNCTNKMESKAYIYYLDFKICEIRYIEDNTTEFEYVFIPDYTIIDRIKGFKGIQGIDLSLRRKEYHRKNMIPSFIFEHNNLPGKKTFHRAVRIDGVCLLDYISRHSVTYFGDKLTIRPL